MTMITPSHLVYSWALARVTGGSAAFTRARTQWFLAGAILPDLPTYLFFFYHLLFTSVSQRELWDSVYFASAWTPFIQASHSFLLWGAILGIGYLIHKRAAIWLSVSALLHVTMDFFVHNDDAYPHFWPLFEWKFISPISYWDPAHYGQYVGTIDTVVVLLLLTWLWHTTKSRVNRIIFITIGIGYLLITFTPIVWVLFNV